MKKVLIRTDSSITIGSGHLMRCLTLAEELKDKEVYVEFVCRNHPGNLIDLVKENNFNIAMLPAVNKSDSTKEDTGYEQWLGVDWWIDAKETIEILKKSTVDCLIIDHYAIDAKWEKTIRPYVKKIMVIDDLANRKHDCDILLDQNLVENMERRYDKLVPAHCIKLLGPQYALLRAEFIKARETLRKRDGNVRKILIFFGGTDPTNETEKAIKAVLMLNRPDISVDVVVGNTNPNKSRIEKICSQHTNINYYCQVNNMAEFMANADLAIGAGGAATWERCYLGLPTINLVLAMNQERVSEFLESKGIIKNLGIYHKVTAELINFYLNEYINNPVGLSDMSLQASSLYNDKTRSSFINLLLN